MGVVLRWTGYPVLLLGAAVAVLPLTNVMPAAVAMNLVNGVTGLLILGLERVIPFSSAWARSRGDVPTDLAYLGFSGALVLLASLPLMTLVSQLALMLGAWAGGDLWPSSWPLIAQLGLALVLYELGSYGLHWLSHGTRLWRLHSVHHSVERLYWLNSVRSHPLDLFLAVTATSGPLLLLGAGPEVFAVVTVLGTTNMWLQHANADFRTGWLDWVFITPRVHRWHHSTHESEQRRNLGAILLVWDLFFGTRWAPREPAQPARIGSGVEAYPQTFFAQLRAPFRRQLWR